MNVMQKINEDTYKNMYVTSDTHFGHNKEFIYKNRGYSNPVEMNNDMIKIINETVGENGILLHLGDFCLNTTKEEYQNLMSRFRIKELWMLYGNHNSHIMKCYGGTVEQVTAWHQNTFIRYLGHYFTFRRGRKEFVCSHFPFRSWDNMANGSFHLHGHEHNNHPLSRADNPTHKVLDVGWDGYGKPLTMQEIEDIMETKSVNNIHHFNYE